MSGEREEIHPLLFQALQASENGSAAGEQLWTSLSSSLSIQWTPEMILVSRWYYLPGWDCSPYFQCDCWEELDHFLFSILKDRLILGYSPMKTTGSINAKYGHIMKPWCSPSIFRALSQEVSPFGMSVTSEVNFPSLLPIEKYALSSSASCDSWGLPGHNWTISPKSCCLLAQTKQQNCDIKV